jgi:dTDP-4-amino-4,6-dideoxygalactose transaminase
MSKVSKIKFLNLNVVDERESEDLVDALKSHLVSGKFLIADSGEDFESEFAAFHGRLCCLGVNSGTDALTIGLRLLNLEPGSLVITTPFSWIASSTCLLLAGLKPLFVDIDDNLQIDLDRVDEVLTASSGEIKAVLVPHLHGNVTSLTRLADLRLRHGVKIIEDCAQGFCARDSDGNLAGSVGDIAAFSFNPMKVLGALGDAGAVLFDNKDFIERARSLRHSGLIGTQGLAQEFATNCRIDALQASFLRVRLKYFDEKVRRRREICDLYNTGLSDYVRPITEHSDRSNHYCYQTVCEKRDELASFLLSQDIEARIRHDFLIPDHPIFGDFPGSCPNARHLVTRTLCLPMHHQLGKEDVHYVIRCVQRFYNLGG